MESLYRPCRSRRVVGAVLLDLYGVLIDSEATRRRYRRLLVDHLSERHGGEPARWAAAHEAAHSRYTRRVTLPSFWQDRGYPEAMRDAEEGFLRDLFAEAQRPLPEGDLLAYAQDLDTALFAAIDAAYPESRGVLVELRSLGVEILAATGAHLAQARAASRGSWLSGELHGLLTADLLGARKVSPAFWRAAFSSLRRKPWDCLVVDDEPGKLEPAARLGAAVTLVWRRDDRPPYLPFRATVLRDLRGLPDAVRRLQA
jgi:HAD superfamily hydrolase (TIGR01509 family)